MDDMKTKRHGSHLIFQTRNILQKCHRRSPLSKFMHLYNKNALTLERKFLQIIVLETLIVIQTRAMDAK